MEYYINSLHPKFLKLLYAEVTGKDPKKKYERSMCTELENTEIDEEILKRYEIQSSAFRFIKEYNRRLRLDEIIPNKVPDISKSVNFKYYVKCRQDLEINESIIKHLEISKKYNKELKVYTEACISVIKDANWKYQKKICLIANKFNWDIAYLLNDFL